MPGTLLLNTTDNLATITTAGSTLITGGAGKYFFISNSSTNFYVWFQTGTETDPAVGGRTGIQIVLVSAADYTAQDVANILINALNTYQITQISVAAKPPAGSYFTFSSNAGSLRNFYVWFTVDGAGTDPNPSGKTPIRVDTTAAMSTAQIMALTVQTVNKYQYAAPDFRGMFFRANDPNISWDADATQRWSTVTGIGGNVSGTFENEQFLNHLHNITNGTNFINGGATMSILTSAAGGSGYGAGGGTVFNGLLMSLAGGHETRPTNTYINPYIRY
jgi:hypothetical protein